VAERFQIFRLLHDTVINTWERFARIEFGYRIQERSRFDLSALAERSTVPVAGRTALLGNPTR
jgi:hypothetical protein